MLCPKCGTESTSGRKFCPECGNPLPNRCAKCGGENSPSAKFCEDCGTPLGAPAAAASATKTDEYQIRVAHTPYFEVVDGERKTVTALFADIKGSTGHAMSLQARHHLGDLVGAEDHFVSARVLCEAPGFLQIEALVAGVVLTFCIGSWNAWIAGHADAARERDERMRRVLEGPQRNPFVTELARISAAVLHAMLREFARAEALAAEALASCEEHGFSEATMWARIPLGLARAELGHTAEGVALLRQALARATESGWRLHITRALTYLAEAQALDGAVADALRTIDDGLQANSLELSLGPETLRVRGELRLRQGDSGAAEAAFREAISFAQKMSAKAWELRATTSLARLDNNRRDEARAMLADIYGWFTEGFDTADLKDAEALLDELSD